MDTSTSTSKRIQEFVNEVEQLAGLKRANKANENLPYDKVLTSINSETTRQEAIITNLTENSVQLKFKGSHNWYSPGVIVDNLGQATDHEIMAYALEPPVIETVQYQTGTYILESNLGTLLVEIDRIQNEYFIRLAGTAATIPLTKNIIPKLFPFSDPDNGNYLTEPGIYLIKSLFSAIEIIPYNQANYYRLLDSPELYRLTPETLKSIIRIESDSLDINAVMIVDKSELEQDPLPSEPHCSGVSGNKEEGFCGAEEGCCAPNPHADQPF